MFSDIISLENLKNAYFKFIRNITDTQFFGDLSLNLYEKHLEFNLLILQRRLEENTYEPNELRIYKINKEEGDIRQLYKRPYEDCIVEIAILNILGPVFEEIMDIKSFGNRLFLGDNPNNYVYKPYWNEYQNFQNEINSSISILSEEHKILKSDIKQYFDEIDVNILLEKLRAQGISARTIDLIEKFLNISTKEGRLQIVPQGTFLAPFLANIYLIQFDTYIREKGVVHYFRYIDDFVTILRPDQNVNDFFSNLENLLENEFKLRLHPPTTDILSEDFKKAYMGELTPQVKEKFKEEYKKQVYGETKFVERLIKSRELDLSSFLQILLLYTLKNESKISQKQLIKYTQSFLTFWRETFTEYSSSIEIERIACKILDFNMLINNNTIRLFISIMLETNRGNFSNSLIRLLKRQNQIFIDSFLSLLPYYVKNKIFETNSALFEILRYYKENLELDYISKIQIALIVLLSEDVDLIYDFNETTFRNYIIFGYQVLHKLEKIPNEGRNVITYHQLINGLNSIDLNECILILRSYKIINYLKVQEDFFNYCSSKGFFTKITSNQTLTYLFVRLLIFCNGLKFNFSNLLDSRDSFTIKMVEKILYEFLNSSLDDLGLASLDYYNMLNTYINYFSGWAISEDIRMKLRMKVVKYFSEYGLLGNYPFAITYPYLHFLEERPTIIKEIHSNVDSLTSRGNLNINNFEESKPFIKECFGNKTMITDIIINDDKKELIIEYQIRNGFHPLKEYINNPDASILQIILKLIEHLKNFKKKTDLPFLFLNLHNIYINPNSKEINLFGFFPNLKVNKCQYFPNFEASISFSYNDKNDYKCLGYLLFEIFSDEKISLLKKININKTSEIKNPFINYIIKKLLSNYDQNYLSYNLLEKDIKYAISKWEAYENEYNDFFKLLDLTIFKIIKYLYVIQNPKRSLSLFSQGKKLLEYLRVYTGIIKYLKIKDIQNYQVKEKVLCSFIKKASPFGIFLINLIEKIQKELDECKKIKKITRIECFNNFIPIFYFLLFFTELERYIKHFITLAIREIRRKIEKEINRYKKIELSSYSIILDNNNNPFLKDIILKIIELNLDETIIINELLSKFDNFSQVFETIKFFSTESLRMHLNTDEQLCIQIQPPLFRVVDIHSLNETSINQVQEIYEKGLKDLPISSDNSLSYKKTLEGLIEWLFQAKLNLKIFSTKVINFEKYILDKSEIIPLEIKYWNYFKLKRKKIFNPLIIPLESIFLEEKKYFPVEFVRKRFRSKLPSYIYLIQYANRRERMKKRLSNQKTNIIIGILDILILLLSIPGILPIFVGIPLILIITGFKPIIENTLKK